MPTMLAITSIELLAEMIESLAAKVSCVRHVGQDMSIEQLSRVFNDIYYAQGRIHGFFEALGLHADGTIIGVKKENEPMLDEKRDQIFSAAALLRDDPLFTELKEKLFELFDEDESPF